MRHLIKVSMVLLASVAVFFVYSFTAQVAPWYVALLSAGSLVSVYLGLAYVPIPQAQRQFAIGISALAMFIEMLYGVLYVLNVQAPYLFEPPLPLWADISLAVLHGAPFTVLLFSVSVFVVHQGNQASFVGNEERVASLVQQATVLLAATNERLLALPEPHQATEEALQVQTRTTEAIYACPKCGQPLTLGQYGAAVRNGYCRACKS